MTALPEAAIVGDVRLRVALLVMRVIFQPDLAHRLPGILSLVPEVLEDESALGSLQITLNYMTLHSAPVTKW